MGTVTNLQQSDAELERAQIALTAFHAVKGKRTAYAGNPHKINFTLRICFEAAAMPESPSDLRALFGKTAQKLGIFGKMVGAIGHSYEDRDKFSLTIESDPETISALSKKRDRQQFHRDCEELGVVNISSNAMTYARPELIAANDI